MTPVDAAVSLEFAFRLQKARIATLEVENARLREALEPFAKHAHHTDDTDNNSFVDTYRFTHGQMRRAARALLISDEKKVEEEKT